MKDDLVIELEDLADGAGRQSATWCLGVRVMTLPAEFLDDTELLAEFHRAGIFLPSET